MRNDTRSADFMSDALGSSRRFRTFNVIDDYNREALRIEIDTRLPAARAIRALNELIELRDKPKRLRLDNGPELMNTVIAQTYKVLKYLLSCENGPCNGLPCIASP
jgi:putative transposase